MRTSLNVPGEVLDSFDETWTAEGLESRSRAVREAMTEYIERHTELEGIDGDAVAAVAFDYEHTLVIGNYIPFNTSSRTLSGRLTTSTMESGVWRPSTVRVLPIGSVGSSIGSGISTPLAVPTCCSSSRWSSGGRERFEGFEFHDIGEYDSRSVRRDRRSPVFREYMYLSPRIDDDPVILASGTVRTTGRGHER